MLCLCVSSSGSGGNNYWGRFNIDAGRCLAPKIKFNEMKGHSISIPFRCENDPSNYKDIPKLVQKLGGAKKFSLSSCDDHGKVGARLVLPPSCKDGEVRISPDSKFPTKAHAGKPDTELLHPEISFKGQFYPICGDGFWDNDFGARLFCTKLGFSGGKIDRKTTPKLKKTGIMLGMCTASDKDLTACTGKSAVGTAAFLKGADKKDCAPGSPKAVRLVCQNLLSKPKRSSCAPPGIGALVASTAARRTNKTAGMKFPLFPPRLAGYPKKLGDLICREPITNAMLADVKTTRERAAPHTTETPQIIFTDAHFRNMSCTVMCMIVYYHAMHTRWRTVCHSFSHHHTHKHVQHTAEEQIHRKNSAALRCLPGENFQGRCSARGGCTARLARPRAPTLRLGLSATVRRTSALPRLFLVGEIGVFGETKTPVRQLHVGGFENGCVKKKSCGDSRGARLGGMPRETDRVCRSGERQADDFMPEEAGGLGANVLRALWRYVPKRQELWDGNGLACYPDIGQSVSSQYARPVSSTVLSAQSMSQECV